VWVESRQGLCISWQPRLLERMLDELSYVLCSSFDHRPRRVAVTDLSPGSRLSINSIAFSIFGRQGGGGLIKEQNGL
jgi:hypothetical protein